MDTNRDTRRQLSDCYERVRRDARRRNSVRNRFRRWVKRRGSAYEIRRRRRFRKRLLQDLKYVVITTVIIFAFLLLGFTSDGEESNATEHYGQIEYCGTWMDVDDYNAMMQEREAYLKAEQEAAEEEAQKLKEAAADYQAKQEAAAEEAFQYSSEHLEEYSFIEKTDTLIQSRDWDADETEMLARIAYSEAGDQGVDGMALVVCVVLNRVWSDGFPDSIEEVIKEQDQFTAYENGRYDSLTPSDEAYEAVSKVQSGWDESQGALYFESTSNTNTWHKDSLTELFQYKDHIFYTTEG